MGESPKIHSSKARRSCCNIAISLIEPLSRVLRAIAFYEKVIKVKADVAAYLINCFPSA